MKTENYILMRQARETLAGKWGLAVGVYFVFGFIISVFQFLPEEWSLLSLLVSGPMTLGATSFAVLLSRNQSPKFENLFDGFKKYGTAMLTYILIGIFVILWSLLLIIPGIIASLSYSMTYFILIDNPNLTSIEAIRRSKKMMYGYKWKYFLLGLRFIGWAILSVLSLGIGFLWLIPYIQVTSAKFYDDIRDQGLPVPQNPIPTPTPAV